MSRTIFGVALGLALAFAAGCGSKPAPQPAPGAAQNSQDAPHQEPPNTAPPKPDTVRVAWEMDPEKHTIPDAPVTGTLGGGPFAPTAVMEGSELKFRVQKPDQPNPERELTITLPPGSEGKTIKVQPDRPNAPGFGLATSSSR